MRTGRSYIPRQPPAGTTARLLVIGEDASPVPPAPTPALPRPETDSTVHSTLPP